MLEVLNTTTKKTLNLIQQVKNSSLFEGTALIITGTIAAQMLSFIFTPINSRLFGPVYYGEFGVYSATINMVNGLACLGLVSAIVAPKEDYEASLIYRTCLLSVSIFSLVILIAAMLLSPYVKVINISGNYCNICILMSLSIMVINLSAMTYSWGNRKKCYKLLMFNPIIAAVINFLVSFGLGMLGLKSYGLIIGAIAGQVAVIIHLLSSLQPMKYSYRVNDFMYVLRRYRDFPMYQMTTNFMKGIGTQLPVIMMSTYFGNSFIGQYNMGQRLLYMPIILVGSALGKVHFKQATDLVNHGKDPGELTYSTIKFMLGLTFAPFLVCAIFGNVIFKAFLGSEWVMAGSIVKMRSFELLHTALFFSVSYIFVVIKKQRQYFLISVLALLFNNLIVWVCGKVLKDSNTTVLILSITSAVFNYILLFYAFSKTEFGAATFNRLILCSSAVFVLMALIGNYIPHL